MNAIFLVTTALLNAERTAFIESITFLASIERICNEVKLIEAFIEL